MADTFKMTPTSQIIGQYATLPKWQQNIADRELKSRGVESPSAAPAPAAPSAPGGGGGSSSSPDLAKVLKGEDNLPAGTKVSEADRSKLLNDLNMQLMDSGNENYAGNYNSVNPTIQMEIEDALKAQPGSYWITIKPPSGYELQLPRNRARLLAFTGPDGTYNPPTTERQLVLPKV